MTYGNWLIWLVNIFLLCFFILGITNILREIYKFSRHNSASLNSSSFSKDAFIVMSAPQIPIPRNWGQIILVISILVFVLILPMIWLITNQAIQSAHNEGILAGNWTWGSVILFDSLLLITGLYLSWIPLKDTLTLFTEQGLRQPARLGFRHVYLKWSDVKSIDDRHSTIKIMTSIQTVRLNILLFKQPDEFMNEIRKHVPDSDSLYY